MKPSTRRVRVGSDENDDNDNDDNDDNDNDNEKRMQQEEVDNLRLEVFAMRSAMREVEEMVKELKIQTPKVIKMVTASIEKEVAKVDYDKLWIQEQVDGLKQAVGLTAEKEAEMRGRHAPVKLILGRDLDNAATTDNDHDDIYK